MHKIRSQAKHDAWYDDGSQAYKVMGVPLKNPFMKHNSHSGSRSSASGPRALEDGRIGHLSKSHTEPDDGSRLRRRSELLGHHTPEHADTTPGAGWNKKPFAQAEDIGVVPRSESPTAENGESTALFGGKKKSSGETSDTITNSYETADADQLKKRGNTTAADDNEKNGNTQDLSARDPADQTDDSTGKTKPAPKFTVGNQIRNTLFSSWVNVLLVMSPVGIALHYAHVNSVAVFVVNFIAIIPLAGMLSYATEEIALRTGEVMGGLLNASFGNAVELIVSIIALVQDQTLIVQTSLIGSILSNLLLVMGMSFFFGGINRVEQNFNMTVAQTAASLLFLAVSSLIIPTAFDEFANIGTAAQNESLDPGNPKPHVADLSRATSVLLLIVYGCYLFFQLKSHARMFSEPSKKTAKRDVKGKLLAVLPERFQGRSTPTASTENEADDNNDDDNDEPEEPSLSVWVAVITLAASTALVALNAEFLVDAINDVTCGGGISKNFVGLILLPIVGNAAEHATAVTVAVKDKMDLAIGVAVGSSMQIALLVLPFIVVLGWIIGKDDMTLFFDGFQITVVFVAVLLVNYLIQDGKSHWLEGVLLLTLYTIIAVAAWYYPTSPELSDCPT
ncbi:hypothetical protein DV738_g4685, partial [Chaetothyriales sp. CBS 135597]